MNTATSPMASVVMKVCEGSWEAHKSDCSGFAKSVARQLGFHLAGQANDIVRFLRSNWSMAANGREAAAKATDGNLVIGGLEAHPNGHVVVVVPGLLNRGRYPHAYWGRLGGIGMRDNTVNWSWGPVDRDKVEYYYASVVGTAVADGRRMRVANWSVGSLRRHEVK